MAALKPRASTSDAASTFRNSTTRSQYPSARASREETRMNWGLRTTLAMTAVGVLATTSMSYGQGKLVRVRGTIEKVDGQNLEVKSREGKNLKAVIAEKLRMTGTIKRSVSDDTAARHNAVSACPISE